MPNWWIFVCELLLGGGKDKCARDLNDIVYFLLNFVYSCRVFLPPFWSLLCIFSLNVFLLFLSFCILISYQQFTFFPFVFHFQQILVIIIINDGDPFLGPFFLCIKRIWTIKNNGHCTEYVFFLYFRHFVLSKFSFANWFHLISLVLEGQ